MSGQDDPVPSDFRNGGIVRGSMPPSGDPSLELFGQGWAPAAELSADSDSYQGRHRAEDA